jgi:hypothetical protein
MDIACLLVFHRGFEVPESSEADGAQPWISKSFCCVFADNLEISQEVLGNVPSPKIQA